MVLTTSRLAAGDWNAADHFEPIAYEKVVGLNNLLSIAWLSQGLTMAAPVARIVIGEGAGTGYLIAPDLILTNHHVLPDAGTAATASIEFNYQTSWAGMMEPVRRFTTDASRFQTNETLDYAIVRVNESPGDLYGYVDLGNRADAAVNDYVTIIQHPLGGPKEICLTDNKVAAVFGDKLQYATDTEPGSSGSPVFNQSWQIVGLHHAGGALAGPDGKKYFTNEGILIGSVLRDAAAFLGIPDTLYTLAFGDLRAVLVNLVDQTDPPSDPNAVAADLLRTQPRFAPSLDDWGKLNVPTGGDPVAALAGAGVAVGAALRQWARSSGHESIAAPAASDPAPPDGLVAAVSRFNGSSDLPNDVYAAALAAVRGDASLVAPIAAKAAGDAAGVGEARAFVVGVSVGAAAYGPPSAPAPQAPAPDAAPTPTPTSVPPSTSPPSGT